MNKRGEATSCTMCQTHYIRGFFDAFSSLRWTFACVSEWKAFWTIFFPVFVMSSTYPVRQKWEINAFFFCLSEQVWKELRIFFIFFFLQKSRHQPKKAVTLQKSHQRKKKEAFHSRIGGLAKWDTELQLTFNTRYLACHLFSLTYPCQLTHTFLQLLVFNWLLNFQFTIMPNIFMSILHFPSTGIYFRLWLDLSSYKRPCQTAKT